MDDEQALVRRARDGDREAFEELVRRTSRFLHARLYLETGDAHQAEDLVQETFLRAFRSIHQVADPAGFRKWLSTVAGSVLIDAVRRAGRQKRAGPRREGQEALDGVAAPVEKIETIERREKVRAILQSLPEEYRLPLTLRYVSGSDYETITMQLGITAGSLRGLLHRGLQLLRRAVKAEVSNEPR